MNIIDLIQSHYPKLSKGHRAIADFILNHFEEMRTLTAQKVAKRVNVSESTVVRFATEIGFDGYPHFQKQLIEDQKVILTAKDRLKMVDSLLASDDMLGHLLQNDINRLKLVYSNRDQVSFNKAVDLIVQAKRIFLLGVGSAFSLVMFMKYYFEIMHPNVNIMASDNLYTVYEQALTVQEGDLVLAVSFPRYSTRTSRSLSLAKEQKAKILLITDKKENPASCLADHFLYAPSDMAGFIDSISAPFSLISALISAVAIKQKDYLSKRIEGLENIWREYDHVDTKTHDAV